MKPEGERRKFWHLALVLVGIVALVRVSTPNIRMLVQSFADRSAYKGYTDLRDWLTNDTIDKGKGGLFIVDTDESSKKKLPVPLQWGVRVHYLMTTHTSWKDDITLLEVSHDFGSEYYRLIWINDKLLEQVILK